MAGFFWSLLWDGVLSVAAYWTAKLLLPAVSFGYWRVHYEKSGSAVDSPIPRWRSGRPLWAWNEDDGVLYIGERAAIFLGIVFWFAVFMALVLDAAAIDRLITG